MTLRSGGAAAVKDDLDGAAHQEQPAPAVQLRLLGGFDLLIDGESVPVGQSCQRLLSLLAMRDCPMSRVQAAGILWPDVMTTRANANLRSVVWRLRSYPQVISASFYCVRLVPTVVVDVQEWATVARRLINMAEPMDEGELGAALAKTIRTELLPELDDEEWLVPERERYRQLGLHALEALSERLVRVGWFGAAVESALAAVQMDPLRESAHRVLVNAYLAEGNISDARRQYRAYKALLQAELGVRPSSRFDELVRGAVPVTNGRNWDSSAEVRRLVRVE